MTGFDIRNAMYRAFGISQENGIDGFDVNDQGSRFARILMLFGLSVRGAQ